MLERVLPTAVHQSSSQFRAKLARAAMAAAPKRAEELHAIAVADRKVVSRPDEHGTATLWCRLPAPDLLTVRAAIHHRADDYLVLDPTDERTADQRRADALVELIELGAAAVDQPRTASATTIAEPHSARRPRSNRRRGPVVQVVVGLGTLLGDNDDPAELAGYGPIPASLARRIAADPAGTWRRLVTDPAERPVSYGRTRYKPPPDLDEYVRARDRTCAFPHCDRPAIDCENDHILAWDDGGDTNPDNLTPACASHHHLRHDHGWTYVRDPGTGRIEWTSPTRHKYVKPPAALPSA